MTGIGETLKKARESKNLSLESVSQSTKIHLKVLKSLEEDDFKNLPGVLYVKSFLRKYADFLGLAGNEIIDQYLNLKLEPPAQIFTIGDSKEKKTSHSFAILTKLRLPILGFGLAILVVFLIGSILKHHKPRLVQTTHEKKKIAGGESGSEENLLVPQGKNLVLKIRAKKDVWLQLKADGQIIFQHILARGKEESWEAQDNFELWVGDASNLILSLNGQALGSLGRGVKKGIVINHQGL